MNLKIATMYSKHFKPFLGAQYDGWEYVREIINKLKTTDNIIPKCDMLYTKLQ